MRTFINRLYVLLLLLQPVVLLPVGSQTSRDTGSPNDKPKEYRWSAGAWFAFALGGVIVFLVTSFPAIWLIRHLYNERRRFKELYGRGVDTPRFLSWCYSRFLIKVLRSKLNPILCVTMTVGMKTDLQSFPSFLLPSPQALRHALRARAEARSCSNARAISITKPNPSHRRTKSLGPTATTEPYMFEGARHHKYERRLSLPTLSEALEYEERLKWMLFWYQGGYRNAV